MKNIEKTIKLFLLCFFPYAFSADKAPELGVYIEEYDCTVVKVTRNKDGQFFTNCAKGKIPVVTAGEGRVEYIDSDDESRPYYEFVKFLSRNSQNMKRYGYIVDDGTQTKLYENLVSFDRKKRDSVETMEKEIGRSLADFVGTQKVYDEGAILLTRSTKGKPAKIKRFLKHETLGNLWLEEINYVRAGVVIQVPTDSLNEEINGSRASFVSFQLLNGKSISSISWKVGDHYCTLSTDSDLITNQENKKIFFQLAESISYK